MTMAQINTLRELAYDNPRILDSLSEEDRALCQPGLHLLTKTETRVFYALLEDLPRKALAFSCNMAQKTCESHMVKIYRKLNVHTRVGLIRFAVAKGLLTPEMCQ